MLRRPAVLTVGAFLLVLVASPGAHAAAGSSSVDEPTAISVGTTVATGQFVSIAEGIGVTDATSAVSGYSVTLGEGVGVSDATGTQTGQVVDVSESVLVDDDTDVEGVNMSPSVLVGQLSGDEGSAATAAGSFTDTDHGPWTAVADYGDGTPVQPVTVEPDKSFTVNHVYDDDGAYLLTVTVTDAAGGSGAATATVTIDNVAPDATLTGGPGDEGAPVAVSFSGQTDPSPSDTAAGFTYRYACDGVTLGPETTDPTTTCSFDDDGTYTVLARIADKDGGFTDRTTDVVVANAPPTGRLANDGPVLEGAPATVTWSGQSDPSAADTSAGFAYRYACDGVTLGPETTDPTTTCSFDDDGTYTVLARIADKDGGFTDRTTDVVVANAPPTGRLVLPTAPVDEGSSFALAVADIADPSGADTAAGFTIAFDCGAGFGPSATCTALDDPAHAVRARIRDKNGGETILTGSVLVANVAPSVTITGPPAGSLYQVGQPVTFSGSFTDPGTTDTHTATWRFDDAPRAGTVTESGGSGSASLVTSFASPGVYSVALSVADGDGTVGTSSTVDGLPAFVVVYDASAGFVTGGGWITSPAGAYAPSPGATGKATFGLVAKYKPGADKPDGNTEFNFKAGGFDFSSTTYDWLVVAGTKAQYRGQGTVNGVAGYRFLLTVYDGSPDRLRFKVWDASNAVVYDNRRGATDDMDNADPQALGGGSLVIHRK